MLPARQKRKTADARSREWKRRFYRVAAATTLLYVVLSLISFHGKLSPLPTELPVIWAVFLLCYALFKEMLRWNDTNDQTNYRGEFWATFVVLGALWMILWNIVREWILKIAPLPIPSDYEAATVEVIVIYTLSVISSIIYRMRKNEERRPARRRHKRVKNPRAGMKPPVVIAQPAVAKREKDDELPVIEE